MDSPDDPLANMSAPGLQASLLVLIVDDEAPIAEALSLIVEDAGYTALTAYRGKEGLELARSHRPALVITDMMMPQFDGASLIAALRADAESDHHPMPRVVAMTAGGLTRAVETGADAVLPKPFSIEQVEAILRQLLSQDGQAR